MILTGKQLEQLGKDVWGPEWAATLARRLKLTKKRVYRWRDKPDSGVPAEIRDAVMAMVEGQLNATSKWVDHFHDRGDLDAA